MDSADLASAVSPRSCDLPPRGISAQAAGGSLADVVKLTLFLTDLSHFPKANEIMQQYVAAPYPARSTVGVASLPRGAQFEVEATMVLS